MARRLPSLVRRSVQMAWRVDRGATIGLLVCQIGTGLLAALSLLAVTGTITALISSGDITERLWDAAPQLAVIAAATGLRTLLGITVVWLTGRLRPVLGRAAELTMIEAALGAELAANNKPGYNDAYDIADRGAQVTPDLVEEAQDVLAATATLAAGATVLTVLHPLLLPLLFLACLPPPTSAPPASSTSPGWRPPGGAGCWGSCAGTWPIRSPVRRCAPAWPALS